MGVLGRDACKNTRQGSQFQTFAHSCTLGTLFASLRLLDSRRSIFQVGKLFYSKMPGDAKLETADELLELYNNPDKLKAYKYTQPIVSTKGINNEKFHMELPYQEIKSIVEKCGEDLLSAVPPEERAGSRWEHVGSTSIEGMPGAMMPDALLEDHKLTVHDCTAAKILLECRDMCRSEEWAFEDYKQAKVEASKGTWGEYKSGKGSNSKLLTMLREKHGMGE